MNPSYLMALAFYSVTNTFLAIPRGDSHTVVLRVFHEMATTASDILGVAGLGCGCSLAVGGPSSV